MPIWTVRRRMMQQRDAYLAGKEEAMPIWIARRRMMGIAALCPSYDLQQAA